MTPRKLNIGIVRFPYAGNGSTQAEHPDIGDWLVKSVTEMKADPRVGEVTTARFVDTPITMTRNHAIAWARSAGVDVLIMLDSDQAPDMYLGVLPQARPFFQSSFDFLYQHWDRGPVTIFCPYCGPPAHPVEGGQENPYVFRWENHHTGHIENNFRMEGYSRFEAARQSGIEAVAAGPTGVCMIDMRIFTDGIIAPPYFEYEWKDDGPACAHCHQPIKGPRTHKASTEDVVFFRNVSLNGIEKLGYNPVFCNWDAWAGHWKPWCVGKPNEFTADNVHAQLRNVVLANQRRGETLRHVTKGPVASATGKPAVVLAPVLCATSSATAPEPPAPAAPEADTAGPDLRWKKAIASIRSLVSLEAKIAADSGRLLRIVEIGRTFSEAMSEKASYFKCEHEVHCVVGPRDIRDSGSAILHRNTPLSAAAYWDGKDADLRRIDLLVVAGLGPANTEDAIRAWYRFVREGGTICGDGIEDDEEMQDTVRGCFQLIHCEGDIWAVRKEENDAVSGKTSEAGEAEASAGSGCDVTWPEGACAAAGASA